MLRRFLTAALFATTSVAGTASLANAETKSLIIAGGCFWCVESDFDHVAGVISTTSGFAGGTLKNPTYKNHAGHREVVKIDYDSTKTDYQTLVTTFLKTIDPTDSGGQFCDRGETYAPALFAADDTEKSIANSVLAEASSQLGKSLPVPIKTTLNFSPAGEYHQDYYKSSKKILTRFGLIAKKDAYKKYRKACGRDAGVKKVWGTSAYTGVQAH